MKSREDDYLSYKWQDSHFSSFFHSFFKTALMEGAGASFSPWFNFARCRQKS